MDDIKTTDANKKIFPVLVAAAAVARLVPHPWNFTPMTALGLYAGAKATNLRASAGITLLALLFSDAIIGFYSGMWYVYAASLVPALLGRFLYRNAGASAIAPVALLSSLSFFAITNFMFWATGSLYPHTTSGLSACFAAALPFYRNQFLGDAFYTVALFGIDALANRVLRPLPRTA